MVPYIISRPIEIHRYMYLSASLWHWLRWAYMGHNEVKCINPVGWVFALCWALNGPMWLKLPTYCPVWNAHICQCVSTEKFLFMDGCKILL